MAATIVPTDAAATPSAVDQSGSADAANATVDTTPRLWIGGLSKETTETDLAKVLSDVSPYVLEPWGGAKAS